MKFDNLFGDERGVSPVIGVILMVAITVILAAVIGTFVLGIGQNQQTTPQASFDFEYDSSSTLLTITHAGGATFTNENTNSLTVLGGATEPDIGPGGSTEVVQAGDTITINADTGSTVRIRWTAPGGDKTSILASFDVPS